MGLFDRLMKPSAPTSGEPRYRAAEIAGGRGADGQQVLLRRGPGQVPQLLSAAQVEILRRCTRPLTLSAHAAALSRSLRLDEPGRRGLHEQLGDLVARGLLVESPPALAPSAEPEPHLLRTAVFTRDRTDLARRCLSEHGALAQRFERPIEVTVFDDHPSSDSAARKTELLAGAPGRYAGRAERERVIEALSREAGVDPELVRYALFGCDGLDWTAGANRNAALLDGAGSLVLFLDDDLCGRLTRIPGEPSAGTALGPSEDPTQIFLYRDQEAALAAARFESIDPWAIHEQVLGRSLRGALQKAGGLTHDEAPPRLFSALESPAARVGVSTAGLAGDSGMGSSFHFLLLQGEARARLFADYEHLRTTRGLIRAAPRLTLTDATHLMSPHLGLDLRSVPPPFHPVARNSDGIYGATLRLMDPDAYVAHLPWAAEHRPPARGFDQLDPHRRPLDFDLADLVLLCLQGAPFLPGTRKSEERLLAVGRHLQGLAALPTGDLEEWLLLRRAQQLGRLSETIAERLDQAENPPQAWVSDLETVLEGLASTLGDPAFVAPADLAESSDRPTRAQRLIGRYGALLEAWPALFACARHRSQEGTRVAEPA